MFQLSGKTVCAAREIPLHGSAVDVLERLRSDPMPWLLDSALPSDLGRFSFAGVDPYLILRSKDGRTEVECRRAVGPGMKIGRFAIAGDPLEIARQLLPAAPAQPAPADLPFLGGAVGYLAYELADQFDAHHFNGIDDLGLPELYLLFVDRFVAHDNVRGQLFACGLGFAADLAAASDRAQCAVDELCTRIEAGRSTACAGSSRTSSVDSFAFFDASEYAKAVNTAKEEIEAGEVYQTCLTHRIERDCDADPWALYRALRRLNPAPFASYFELPEVAIVGSSPERFLRLDGTRQVESRPIKGTRPRGNGAEADLELRSALQASPKDRAENLMIVDLVRNDLGRVCEIGSVEVPELMAIESYASVHQMVSTITGRLRDDCDVFDLVRATFPPGSMTGAPKVAAMRILDELEPVRRGIYSGALGYFDVRGGADLCVVIRTILTRDGRAYLHTGGGIVADSNPEEEWRESLDKARLLEVALDETQRR